MATIDAKTGQIMDGAGAPDAGAQSANPYNTYVSNMGNLLSYITSQSSAGNTALQSNIDSEKRFQAGLANNTSSNPLSFIFNSMPGSARTGTEATLSEIAQPSILSNQAQANVAEQNSSNLTNEVNSQMNLYTSMKPNWQLSPQPDPETGKYYFFNTNVQPGQQPQIYTPGEVPPSVGGSAGGSPASAAHPTHLADANNPYGIKMSATTTKLFEDLGVSPGPSATDGGNFWVFPDATSAEKAARRLLQSPTYASDSVDQALRQWSNYTGTGQYPGYNSSILKGTGIDPNAIIKNLTPTQMDVVLQKMKEAENVGTNTAPTAPTGPKTQSGATFEELRKSSPPYVSSALNQVQSTGSAYIDLSKIPSNFDVPVRTFAKNHNIPILNADQVSNAQNTDEAIRNIINVVAPAWAKIAPDGPFSRLYNVAEGPFSALADTDFFSLNKTFSQNTESLAQQISALSKSAPRLGLLQTAKSALPSNQGYGANGLGKLQAVFSGSNYDTYLDGVNKMNRTLQLLEQSLNTYVPGGNSVPQISTTKHSTGGSTISNGVDLSKFNK